MARAQRGDRRRPAALVRHRRSLSPVATVRRLLPLLAPRGVPHRRRALRAAATSARRLLRDREPGRRSPYGAPALAYGRVGCFLGATVDCARSRPARGSDRASRDVLRPHRDGVATRQLSPPRYAVSARHGGQVVQGGGDVPRRSARRHSHPRAFLGFRSHRAARARAARGAQRRRPHQGAGAAPVDAAISRTRVRPATQELAGRRLPRSPRARGGRHASGDGRVSDTGRARRGRSRAGARVHRRCAGRPEPTRAHRLGMELLNSGAWARAHR